MSAAEGDTGSGIDRRVGIEAPPIRVAAELALSPWRSAYSIEPAGAGSRVCISARIEPEALARSIEEAMLSEVCDLATRLSQELAEPSPIRQATPTPATRKLRRTSMTIIERTVTIDAPPEQVWPALADIGGISVWNPNVKASRLTSSQDEGAGTSRECQLTPMGTVQERVVEWDEGRMVSIEIYEFKNVPAMRRAVATFELQPHPAGTRVRMHMDYEVGLGAMGAGMNALMMKRQFGSATTKLLAGLKLHVETGRPVEKGAKLPVQAVA